MTACRARRMTVRCLDAVRSTLFLPPMITLAVFVLAAADGIAAGIPNGFDFGAYATNTRCGALTLSGNSYTDSFDSTKGTYTQTKQLNRGFVGSSGNVTL